MTSARWLWFLGVLCASALVVWPPPTRRMLLTRPRAFHALRLKTWMMPSAPRFGVACLMASVPCFRGPPDKRAQLTMLSCQALKLPLTGRLLASILGNWSCHLQFRRPGYSVFQHAYVHQSNIKLDTPHVLPPHVRSELLLMAALAPGLVCNHRADVPQTVCMLRMQVGLMVG